MLAAVIGELVDRQLWAQRHHESEYADDAIQLCIQ